MSNNELFFIDTRFGVDFWITVQDSIVVDLKYVGRHKFSMEEAAKKRYIGKTISYMEEDYTKAMKGCWLIFKSLSVTNEYSKIESLVSRIVSANKRKEYTTGDLRAAIDVKIKELQFELETHKTSLMKIKESIRKTHGFEPNKDVHENILTP